MIRKWIGPHKWLLPFALAVAVWQIVPIFLMSSERAFYKSRFPDYFNSWTFNGSFSILDNFSAWEDTYQYAARIRDAGSHALPGDPYIKGNRTAAMASRDFIVFYALGWIYRLTRDIHATYTATNFLFGFLWVLSIYAVMLKTGVKHEAALFVAVVTTLFADIGQLSLAHLLHLRAGLGMLFQYLLWPLGSYHYWFGPTRLYRPQFTIPCLLLAALAWIRSDKKRTWPWAFASGLTGGALAYVHLDVWAVYIGAAVFFSACAAFRRRFSVKAAVSLAVTLLASLPAFLLIAAIKSSGASGNIEYGRALNAGALPFLLGAWASYRYFKEEPMTLWIGSALAAAFALANLQVATGWSIGGGSHAVMTGNYFLALLAGRWLASRVSWPKSAWLWLSALALALSLPRLISFSALHYKIYALPRAEEEAFQWLERNTPQDAVVGALSPKTYMQLPVYTHDKTLVSFVMPILSDIPALENARRIVYALSLFGANPDDYVREAEDASGRWGDNLWLGVADGASRERSGTFSAHFWDRPTSECAALLRQASRDPGRGDYEVDYLWLGPFERGLAAGGGPDPSRWKKVFENGSVALFQRVATGPGS